MASEGKIAKVSIKSARGKLVGLNQDRTLQDTALQLDD